MWWCRSFFNTDFLPLVQHVLAQCHALGPLRVARGAEVNAQDPAHTQLLDGSPTPHSELTTSANCGLRQGLKRPALASWPGLWVLRPALSSSAPSPTGFLLLWIPLFSHRGPVAPWRSLYLTSFGFMISLYTRYMAFLHFRSICQNQFLE